MNFKPGESIRIDDCSVFDKGSSEEKSVLPNRSRTYDPYNTSTDTLTLSYRTLEGAKAR